MIPRTGRYYPLENYVKEANRASSILLAACLFAGIAVAAPEVGDGGKRKPNVIIFLTDDQGTLDANCYGSGDLYTPTMDKLAKSGVRFTQAYAHFVCCPTRAALLTGRYPQRANVNGWTQGNAKAERKGRNMFLEEITIAELLKGAGYSTGLFGKWHLGAHLDSGPLEQGFDEFYGHRGGFIDNYNHHFLHGAGFHDLFDGKREIFDRGSYFPDLMIERALAFIDRHQDSPFFLYVAFNIPHYPEQPDTRFDERYKDLPMPRQSYAKMISTTDDRMGQIMTKIEKLGLLEETIVIFMSDNGASAEDAFIRVDNHTSGLPKGHHYGAFGGGGNTGEWRGAKATYYEGGVRVPAIVSYPSRLPRGAVRDQAITVMDWLPTIADLCAIPLPEVELDGRSLVPIIRSSDTPSHNDVLHWQFEKRWAVREGNWKLISTHQGKPGFLANLSDREPERRNHIDEQPAVVERLLELHNDWFTDVMSPH